MEITADVALSALVLGLVQGPELVPLELEAAGWPAAYCLGVPAAEVPAAVVLGVAGLVPLPVVTRRQHLK